MSSEHVDGSTASPSMQALFDAYCLFDPKRLSSQTELMDRAGKNLRSGSSVLVSLGPDGLIRLQGDELEAGVSCLLKS